MKMSDSGVSANALTKRAGYVVMALLLVLASVSAVQGSKEPGYMEVEKDNKTVRVPVVILGNESAESYWGPGELASGVDVRITSPGDGLNTTMENISAYGRAWAEGTVDSVEYRLNNGTWKTANGTVSWRTDEFQLQEGPNTLEVRATDGQGDIATDSATVHYSTLTLDRLEWRAYKVNMRIWKGEATFYTDTGFKVVLTGEDSYSTHVGDPVNNPLRLKVYDPKGRLYASSITMSLGKGTTVHVTRGDGKTIGILDWSYGAKEQTRNWHDCKYIPFYWDGKKLWSRDWGTGWLIVKNLKVYINEPISLQKNINVKRGKVKDAYSWSGDGSSRVVNFYHKGSVNTNNGGCYTEISGNFVIYGDETDPVVIGNSTYAKETYDYYTYLSDPADYPWQQDKYSTIHHPSFKKTQVTNDEVIVRVKDDRSTYSTHWWKNLYNVHGENTGVRWLDKTMEDGLNNASPRLKRVSLRRVGGAWVKAQQIVKRYPWLKASFWGTYVLEFGVPTEYASTSASALGLIQNQWNTVEVKATDWSGRTSNSKVRVFYDTLSPEISTTIPPTVRRPVFKASVTATDNFKMDKLQVRISDGEFTVNGKTYMSGEWATVSASKGADSVKMNLKDITLGAGTVNFTMRAYDEAGNMRERVKTVDADAPPIFVLTSHKDGGTYGPAKNAMFDGYMRNTAPPQPYVWMKVNNGQWAKMRINPDKDSVHVESNKLLFEPNSWNTLHVMTKSRDGRKYQYSIEVYYNEPDKVVYDFDSLTRGNPSTYPEGWNIVGFSGGYSNPNAAYRRVVFRDYCSHTDHHDIHLSLDGHRVQRTGGGWNKNVFMVTKGIHSYKFTGHLTETDGSRQASGKIASAKLAFSRDRKMSYMGRAARSTVYDGCGFPAMKGWVDDVTFTGFTLENEGYVCTLRSTSGGVDIGPNPNHYFTYAWVDSKRINGGWWTTYHAKLSAYNETAGVWGTIFNRWPGYSFPHRDKRYTWYHPSADYTGIRTTASKTEYLECTLP